jgi:hypothetical protein
VKFFPYLSELREFLDGELADWQRHQRLTAPQLPRPRDDTPPPRAAATRSALLARYGLSAIPPGWDALDLAHAGYRFGADLPAAINQMLAEPSAPAKPSIFQRVVDKLRPKSPQPDAVPFE